MPTHCTDAAMSINGWVSLDTTGTPQSQNYYFEAFDFKPNTASANSLVSNLYTTSFQTYMYGKDNAKSYIVKFDSTGNIVTNLSTTSTSLVPTAIVVDGNASTHVLIGATNDLMKYDVTGTKVLHKRFTLSPSIGTGRFLAIDSANYIYMLTSTGTNAFSLIKLDTSYNVIWSKYVTQGATTGVGTVNKVEIDGSQNVYVILDDFVYKFTSGGVLSWQKKITGSIYPLAQVASVDNGGNLLILSGIDYLKFNSSGTKIFEKATNINAGNGNICSSTLSSTGDILGLTNSDPFGNSFKIVSFTTTDTPSFVANTVYSGNSLITPQQVKTTNTNSFVSMKLDNPTSPGRYTQSTMRLPSDGKLLSISTSYSFNVIADNGTVYTYSGNINSSAGTTITLTNTTNWNITIPTFSAANMTVSTSNITGDFSSLSLTQYTLTLP